MAPITRTGHDRTGTHTKVGYLITSLTPRQADPRRLLVLIRGPWRIAARH